MKKVFLSICLMLLTIVGAKAQSETLKVWLDDNVTFTADGKMVSYLHLYENDGDQGYTSFNMSLFVPKGIHINQVKQGRDVVNDITLSERGTNTHMIVCNMPSDTLLKVASISTLNQDLYNDDENGNPLDLVWTIGLVADPTMVNGDYEVRMVADDLVFNMKQGDTYVSSVIKEDVICTFTITGGVISSVSLPETDKKDLDLYDLSGRKVKYPTQHGIYIEGGKKVVK